MKALGLVILLLVMTSVPKQDGHEEEIRQWQEKLNEEFTNPDTSPLAEKARKSFDGLDFFPVSEKYRVRAALVRTPGAMPFSMPTTTERVIVYKKYGEAHFTLDSAEVVLSVYQNLRHLQTGEYRDYLFAPFTDLTSGYTTYGGGRYLDLTAPSGDSLLIDFNKAYNPYCAYNENYSCPLPPAENDLRVAIQAGVKAWEK